MNCYTQIIKNTLYVYSPCLVTAPLNLNISFRIVSFDFGLLSMFDESDLKNN